MMFVIMLFMLKGVVGVFGSGFVVLVVMFVVMFDFLVVGVVLLVGIDCFMLEVCVLISVISNVCVVIFVLLWEGVCDCVWFVWMFVMVGLVLLNGVDEDGIVVYVGGDGKVC